MKASVVACLLFLSSGAVASPAKTHRRQDGGQCKRTQVAILGAGTAGIAAAQALSNQSVTDFVIVEYNDGIGGRMKTTSFGEKPDGSGPYTLELGANWVQGLGTEGGPQNPVWELVKKWNVLNEANNYSSIASYNETGEADFLGLIDELEDAWSTFEQDAGTRLVNNLQDRSARAGLRAAGWNPAKADSPPAADAVEYWYWDWEWSFIPEVSSQVFGVTNYNVTYYTYSDENQFVLDERGFKAWLVGEASTFLSEGDTRLMLNTTVTNITYSDSGVRVDNEDGSCIEAEYALCTFSLGVLQEDVVTFEPELPEWKLNGINSFEMGTYTKIFYQFNKTFWPNETQFFIYADPTTRGYWPVWQSLTPSGFLEGSNIIFGTMSELQSHRIERQDDETTMREGLEVLRKMFPDVDVPEPTAFLYPRWTSTPWSFGSYSNWPPGTTLEMHQNLRANVERLFFAGEATSAPYYGFLQGAWLEGVDAGQTLAGMITGNCLNVNITSTGDGNVTESGFSCALPTFYKELHGTTEIEEYSSVNGWDTSSFSVYGLFGTPDE